MKIGIQPCRRQLSAGSQSCHSAGYRSFRSCSLRLRRNNDSGTVSLDSGCHGSLCHSFLQRHIFVALRLHASGAHRRSTDITHLLRRQIFAESLLQQGTVHRLGQIFNKSLGNIHFPHAHYSIGGENYEGNIVVAGYLPCPLHSLDTVHTGHHVIHQYQVEAFLLHQLQRLHAAVGSDYMNLRFLQKSGNTQQIQFTVVYYQHICLRSNEADAVFRPTLLDFLTLSLEVSYLGGAYYLLRQYEGEGGTYAVLTGDLHITAHSLRQSMSKGQTETGSFNRTIPVQVKADKGLEQIVHILRLDTDTRIGYSKPEYDVVTFLSHLFTGNGQRNTAFIGVLDSIVQQIYQHLPDSDGIALQLIRQVSVYIDDEGELFFLCLHIDHGGYFVQQASQTIVARHDIHLAGLDLGEVKDIIYQRKERP